jgi:transposase
MLRLILTIEQQAELRALRRDPALSPAERERLEMLALSAAGWPVGAIATHFGRSAETVRRVFRRFPAEGLAAARRHTPGPPPDASRRRAVEGELLRLLEEERTRTSAQLAEALAGRGMRLSGRQVRRYLRGLGAGWRRTKRTLGHKQDPIAARRAGEALARLARGQGTAD